MLLPSRNRQPQATVTGRPTARPHADTRRAAHRAGITTDALPARPACPPASGDKWLVGLEFITADRHRTRLYYVVDGALDTTQAVREGNRRAGSELRKRTARTGREPAGELIEVRQLHQDLLGHVDLAPSRP